MNQKKKMKNEIRRERQKEYDGKKEKIEEMVQMIHTLNIHINERQKENQGERTKKIVEEIISNGGVSKGGFWDVKRKMEEKKDEHNCPIKDEKGKLLYDGEDIKDEYKKYYKKLLNVEATDDKTEEHVQKVFDQILKLAEGKCLTVITEEEITGAVKELKLKKACDTYGWCNEMIICAGKYLKESIIMMMNAKSKRTKSYRKNGKN